MHPRIILAIVRKDARDILLNRASIAGLLLPIVLTLLWVIIAAIVGSSSTTSTTSILVYNPGQSKVAQVVINAFPDSQVTLASTASEVTAAFGANGLHESGPFAVGLIVPVNFDRSLRAGATNVQVMLYTNGNDVDSQTAALLQAAIANYARSIADPHLTVNIASAMINPSAPMNAGTFLAEIYTSLSLLISFSVGTSLTPGLLLEEKEQKTLRMLMVTKTSFGDVVVGKLLVMLIYQLAITAIVLAMQGAFTGQVPLVLLFMLLGAFFSISLGLLFGCIFKSSSVARAVGGFACFIYIIPGIFGGPLAPFVGSNPVVQSFRIIPTYYIVDGVYNAIHNQLTWENLLADVVVITGCTIILLAVSTLILRRQALAAATL
jgi:ABC-2 type transport system permease protein